MFSIALHHSIDGGGRHVWHVNLLVQVLSFFAEASCTCWQVVVYVFIDVVRSEVIAAFYHVNEVWVMHETFPS